MQERKGSYTATKSSPRKDEIEATKGIINFRTKHSYSPAVPLLCVAKEQTRRFQGESFLFPENWGIFKVMQNPATHPLLPPLLGDAAWSQVTDCAQRGAALSSTGAGTRSGILAQLQDHPQILYHVFGSVTTQNQGSWQVLLSYYFSSHFTFFLSFSFNTAQLTFSKHIHMIKFK